MRQTSLFIVKYSHASSTCSSTKCEAALAEKGRFASPDLRRTDTEVTQKSYLRRMPKSV